MSQSLKNIKQIPVLLKKSVISIWQHLGRFALFNIISSIVSVTIIVATIALTLFVLQMVDSTLYQWLILLIGIILVLMETIIITIVIHIANFKIAEDHQVKSLTQDFFLVLVKFAKFDRVFMEQSNAVLYYTRYPLYALLLSMAVVAFSALTRYSILLGKISLGVMLVAFIIFILMSIYYFLRSSFCYIELARHGSQVKPKKAVENSMKITKSNMLYIVLALVLTFIIIKILMIPMKMYVMTIMPSHMMSLVQIANIVTMQQIIITTILALFYNIIDKALLGAMSYHIYTTLTNVKVKTKIKKK